MTWQDGPQTLNSVSLLPQVATPDLGPAKPFDLAKWIPISLIREHTKTDDVPSVSDDQLGMYRMAGIEACEQYTGFLLREQRSIVEPVQQPMHMRTLKRGYFTHTLQYPSLDGVVYLYGAPQNAHALTIRIAIGSRRVRVPVMMANLDLSSSCCRPICDTGAEINGGMQLMYRAGFKSNAEGVPEGVPAGLTLGILKYIAWSITHPGDMLLTVRNRESSDEGLVRGTNNAAWASGALELWRQYDAEAI